MIMSAAGIATPRAEARKRVRPGRNYIEIKPHTDAHLKDPVNCMHENEKIIRSFSLPPLSTYTQR